MSSWIYITETFTSKLSHAEPSLLLHEISPFWGQLFHDKSALSCSSELTVGKKKSHFFRTFEHWLNWMVKGSMQDNPAQFLVWVRKKMSNGGVAALLWHISVLDYSPDSIHMQLMLPLLQFFNIYFCPILLCIVISQEFSCTETLLINRMLSLK